jgi:hypothetical protein
MTNLPPADKFGHRVRSSDASSFDTICVLCGATDRAGETGLEQYCPARLPDAPAAVDVETAEIVASLRRSRFPIDIIAADLIERLMRERDEARSELEAEKQQHVTLAPDLKKRLRASAKHMRDFSWTVGNDERLKAASVMTEAADALSELLSAWEGGHE